MLKDIIPLIITLIKNISVIIVLAYVLTRMRWFSDVLKHRFNPSNIIMLILIFGVFSIYGTLSGDKMFGAIANFRNIGPTLAGLLGGPIAGLGAGLIGAMHRYQMGGPSCNSCTLATIFAGLIGGIVFKLRRGNFPGVAVAVLITAGIEGLHLLLGLIMIKPYADAERIVHNIAGTMLMSNTLGMGAFAFLLNNLIHERETEAIKETIESELKIAREIQLSMIPKIFPAFPDKNEFDIYAILKPAKEVGGDLYDFFLIDEDNLCFVIGDVSGKGVPASLFMAVTKTLIKAKTEKGMSPDEILFKVNNELFSENESMMFVTLFIGILRFSTGEVIYSNGGHNLPYIIRANGDIESVPKIGGRVVGISENAVFKSGRLDLKNNDMIFLYTDGVTEAMDVKEQIFTDAKLDETLKKYTNNSPQELTLNILSEVEKYAYGAMQSDDITIMTIEYKKPVSKSVHLNLKNNLHEIQRLAREITNFSEDNNLSKQIANDLNLCLEEVVTNIISYGYKDSAIHDIIVNLRLNDNEIEIEVIDDALAFDPLINPEPDIKKPLEERPIGGLGIFLVKKLTDEIKYIREKNHNVLKMKKKIKK